MSTDQSSSNQQTYYQILGVEESADAKTIRSAYLKSAVKHHPDKNPDDVDGAKARFVLIGQAYEVLSDPAKRAQYDHELKRSTGGSNIPSFFSTSNTNNTQSADQAYQSYRDRFDAHVAGMSEADLAAAMGIASVVGSLVGSIVGSKVGNKTGGGKVLGLVGSLAGSMMASQAAADAVRSIHQQSVERVTYQQEQRMRQQQGQQNVYSHNYDNKNFNDSYNGNRNSTNPSTNYDSMRRSSYNSQKQEIKIDMNDVANAVNAGVRLFNQMRLSNRQTSK